MGPSSPSRPEAARCPLCPVPAGRPCVAARVPRYCELLALGRGEYRAIVLAKSGAAGEPAPDAPEPPLPSPLRMAGQLARAAQAVVAHAATTGEVYRTPEAQAACWAACRACAGHFRPSDRRCGAADGCGCFLDAAIPLAAKHCPIGRW